MSRTAVIVGAGPAGLTAAYELLQQTDVRPVVLESDSQVGGIAKTVEYRGNRMDLGGHRFFSKSQWVMQWWQSILPVATDTAEDADGLDIHYHGQRAHLVPEAAGRKSDDRVMLVRRRLSRIFYRRRFFDYPLSLGWQTVSNLGPVFMAEIAASYAVSRALPRRPERTLEDFLVNRFGAKLYRTFFKDYTEKVWGVPCEEISAEWGAQRIKGLSIGKALWHAASKPFRRTEALETRGETSLIERFLYPKLGPGQLWEEVARRVTRSGGVVRLNHRVVGLQTEGQRVTAVDVLDTISGERYRLACDHFISSMPVTELVRFLKPDDSHVAAAAAGLPYRDFMTAGLLLRRMRGTALGAGEPSYPPDNWIYVQEPDVRLGRLQIFNNWSPALVADPDTVWLGLEYFCAEGDDLWSVPDARFLDFAAGELESIGLIQRADVLDGTVVRVPKAYPAYFGTYRDIDRVRAFLDRYSNLLPIGRNGMHRYNNQDHSMLAARAAVQCIASGDADRSMLWSVNTEDEYHEVAQQEVDAEAKVA